ncbi:hypothetical protein MMYC01_206252 [Madurella mycetomatis]|uniref:Acid phosphatase-like protein n=1 Tax=Madurella mycetomatis TaxID=100816 RepID=A0A175VYH3_9PEZI|nr:hypothetical protein MMYC01_206252 [Madurella mycetomatis]
MNIAGIVVLVLVVVAIAGAIWWIIFTRMRAQRLGLPPPGLTSYIPFLKSSSSYEGPSPAPGGIVGWINDRIRLLRHGRNTRTAAGAYEGQSYNAGYTSTGGARGRGFDQDDDAWDSRVGHGPDGYNPYEEERELGLVPPQGQQGDGYQMNLAVGPAEQGEETRGRTRSRSPAPAPPPARKGNPFDDDAEPSNISLRGVSPRPMDNSFAARKARGDEDRRSVFREEV